MFGLISVSLTIIPLSALFFGALYLRKNVNHVHILLFLAAAISGLVYDQFLLYSSFKKFIEKEQWEAMASYLAYTPIIATALVFSFGLLATTLFSVIAKTLKSKSRFSEIKISHAVIIVIISAMTLVMHSLFYANVIAQNEMFSQLSDPETSEDVLREQAQTVSIPNKIALAENPNLPDDVFLKLIQDKTDMVRYVLVRHPKTTNEQLEVLKSDRAKEVRKAAAAEIQRRNKTTTQ